MRNIKIGQKFKMNGRIKQILVTGFWRFEPLEPIADKATRETLQKIIDNDIANGTAVPTERIVPCTIEDAQLISTANTGTSFFDINEVADKEPVGEIDANYHIDSHTHALNHIKKYGLQSPYGRIRLKTKDYPRFFDQNGQLKTTKEQD